jgi:predicted small integral membrane protein
MESVFSEGIGFVSNVPTLGWDAARTKCGLDEAEARVWWEWYEREVCRPWVLFEGEEGTVEIEASEGEGDDLDGLPLVAHDVRRVRFAGKSYALKQAGLYRFIVLTRSVRNLIVAPKGDPVSVLRGLSALQVHGNRDDARPVEELRQLLLSRVFLSITCGTIASVTVAVMRDLGFGARLVSTLTLDPWNTYDNGHSICEIFFPGERKWVLADVDFGFLFRSGDAYLSAGELWDCLNSGNDVEFLPLAETPGDPFFLSPSGFNYFLYTRYAWRDMAAKKAWYRRMLHVIGVVDEGKTFYFGPEDRIRSYCAGDWCEVLPVSKWKLRLYGEVPEDTLSGPRK